MTNKHLSISGLLLLLFSACNTVDTGVLLNHFQTPQEDRTILRSPGYSPTNMLSFL